MARLEAAALPSETVHGTTSSRQIAQDLSNPNEKVREKIKELFGRKHPPMPKHTINKQKNRVSKPLSLHRKKVTVVCVDDKTFSIPTRKIRDKLVEEGKIREMYIGKAETKSVITDKIKKLFNTASHVQFLKATSARDLLPVTFSDEDVQGDSILELIEGNNLYVRASPPAQHTLHAGSSAVQSSLPVEHGAGPLVPPPTFSNTGQPAGTIQQTAGRSATQQSGSGRPPGAIQQTTGKSVTQQSGSGRPPGAIQQTAGRSATQQLGSGRPPVTVQQTAGKSATQQLGSGQPPDAIQQTDSSVHQQFLVGIGRVHATVLPTPKQFNKGIHGFCMYLISQYNNDSTCSSDI